MHLCYTSCHNAQRRFLIIHSRVFISIFLIWASAIMSDLAVRDFLSTNLLSELSLNPMAEKYRVFFFAATVGISLYPFYMTLNGVDIHCVPVNNSEIGELSTPETNYINSLCATDEKLWFQTYAGTMMLGAMIVVLIVSSSWLFSKNVKGGIRTFSDAREIIMKLDLPKEKAIKLCSTPLKGIESDHFRPDEAMENLLSRMGETDYDAEAHKTVRKVIRLFAYHRPEYSILTWFLIRNMLLIFVLLLVAVSSVLLATVVKPLRNNFTCTINRSEISYQDFVCTSSFSEMLYICCMCYGMTVSVHLFTSAFMLLYIKRWDYFCNRAEECNRSPGLLISFSECARLVPAGLFKAFVRYIHSSSFKEKLKSNMKSICDNEDHELIRIKSKLFGDTPEVISALYEIFCSTAVPPSNYFRVKMSIQAIKASKYALNEDVCENIRKFIHEMKRRENISPELIVAMLKNYDDEHDALSSLVSEITALSDSSRNTYFSILYYAFSRQYLRGPHKSAAAKALCRGKDESNLKIYETRISKNGYQTCRERTLMQYLKEIYPEDGEVDKILNECGINRQIWPGVPSSVGESSPLIEMETSV